MKYLLRFGTLIVVALAVGPSPAVAQLSPDLFIACHDASSVARVDVSTNAVTDPFIPSASGGLSIATGVTFGPDGNIYVTGRDSSKIFRYDAVTGAFLDVFADVAVGWIFDARFGPDGNLYVLSDGSGVLRYDMYGAPRPAPGQGGAVFSADLWGLRGIAFGPDGSPYVGNTYTGAIYRLDKTSGVATVFAQGLNPHGLIFGPDGNLYATSSSLGRIERYDGETGASLGSFASGFGDDPIGVAFGPDGDLYVTSASAGQVVHLDGTTGDLVGTTNVCGGGLGPSWITFAPIMVPSTVTATAYPGSLWPANGKLGLVLIEGLADGDGVAGTTGTYAVTDEYGIVEPRGTFSIDPAGAFTFSVPLVASRLGTDKDGRLYTIALTVHDGAGQFTTTTVTVIVPHDQRK